MDKTLATVAASPVALIDSPIPMSEIRRKRADLVLGTRTDADKARAAFAIDCGRNSGLTLIADLEGFDAIAQIAA